MRDENFSIKVIADITCDLNGSVPSTIRTTTLHQPYYDYNPFSGSDERAFSRDSNITVMAINNLPNGLPVEASIDFGHNLIKNVLPYLLFGDHEGIIARATIAEGGELSGYYHYLADWVNEPD
jgi:alanine dehydrogenase